MDPGPYEGNPLSAHFKSWIARLGWPLGSLSALPTPAAFRLRERVVRESLELVDQFYAPSPGVRDKYIEFGIPPEKILFKPYQLDPDRYSDYVPTSSKDGRIRVAFIGQIAPHKGPQILIEALSLLSETERERFLLRMHGGPPGYGHASFLPSIQEAVKRGRLPVEFPGTFSPEKISQVLSQADCVMIPSLWMENQPLVLIHARAVGLPVIASDTMGIRPFLENEPRCHLIPPGDVEAWAEAFRRLLIPEPLRV
ncbi:MAG TPA: glycosyltransferase [Planctomycetes bacterium]|nr:glycosyltransferase [Planctomycetota bacterium]